MLDPALLSNYRSIRSFTSYRCEVDSNAVEREISFHVDLGPNTQRHGDVFPVYRIPQGKLAWLSDWSFNGGGKLCRDLAIGGSLGRIVDESRYVYVLNCAVYAGEMKIFSPARAIRYLAGEWIAVCFHHMGTPLDIQARATFRLVEVPAPDETPITSVQSWDAAAPDDAFPGCNDSRGR